MQAIKKPTVNRMLRLPPDLDREVRAVVEEQDTSIAAFTRNALRAAIRRIKAGDNANA